MNDISLKKVYSSIGRARNFLGKTICEINPNIVLQIFGKNNPKLVGVKNTKVISGEFIKKLEELEYYSHTIDKMSDRGRAIDIDIKNPLTGRNMTGSSSATAVNVLYGINNIGIGTDGGGSVLAPAMALNLYSVLLKGIGICGDKSKKSTDNIEFTPGVGLISQYYEDIEKISYSLLGKTDVAENITVKNEIKKSKILVLNSVDKEIIDLLKTNNIQFQEREMELPDVRDELIKLCETLLEEFNVVIYSENSIDMDGFGDSVFGTMGNKASELQNKANKKIIKVLNMINSSAITLPLKEASSGLVIFTGKGEENFLEILKIGKLLDKERRTELFKKYFLDYSLQEIDNRWFL